jgi:biotin carboxyl carrier protein
VSGEVHEPRAVRVTVVDPSGDADASSARDLSAADVGDEPFHGPRRGSFRDPVVTPGTSRRDGHRRVEVVVDGWRFELDVEDARRADLRQRATRAGDAATPSATSEIRAIIPGRVAAVRVTAGDRVGEGDTLLVIEAMKMQNELRSPRDARVERVVVGTGDTLEAGDLLVVLS